MKPLSDYTKTNKIFESINNNERIINESEFIIEHGKDIDNLLYKFKNYTFNNLYNQNNFNESDNTYKFTLNESNTARDMLIYICEDYRNTLLEELNIYESILENENLILNEGFLQDKAKNIVQKVKQTWELGKDKVNQAIETIKTKIKEVNELIKDYATKAISSVKEMAIKLIELLDKFNCTLKELFSKMGFNTEDEEKSIENIGNDLANNVNIIKKNDIYESYSNDLKLILEEEENKEENNKEETVKQADKKSVKQMIWDGFKQLMIWAGVCVVIPGIVCGLFPGTLIALLVPVVCKLLWNAYKIVKIYKQWKKVKKEWGTYSKTQKVITAIGMVASIIALAINFDSIIKNAAPIWEALTKGGMDLFDKANLGIQPDVLTRGFAAAVKNVSEGKWPWEDFGKSFQGITDAFAEHTQAVTEKVVKATAKIGKGGKELLDEYSGKKFNTSTGAWKNFLKPNSIPIDKVPKGSAVDVIFDGHSNSSEAQKLLKFFADNGVDVKQTDAFNSGLNKICKNAGSIWGLKNVPIDVLKKAQESGFELGHNGWFSILGGVAETVSKTSVITDIVQAASDMLITIPIINVQPQNNGGFRVRLGEKGSKNYVYEVGKDGVKKESVKDYSEQYDKIKEIIYNDNIEYLKQLKEAKVEDSDKNEIDDKLEEFKQRYNDSEKGIDSLDCIIFYGHKVNEEKTEESYKSLYNYIIKEENKEYTIDDIKQNITDLKKYLEHIGEQNDETDHKGKKLYSGNVKILLQAIFSFNENNETHDWNFDEDYKATPYDTIKKRMNDKDPDKHVFGPEDVDYLAISYCIWFGPDNETSYEGYRKAFVDLFILRKLLMNSNELNDTIIAAYSKVIENIKEVKNINNDIKDKEWKPKEEWAPIKFNENKIDDEAIEKVEKTEDNNLSDNSKEEAEKELKKDEAPIPDKEDKNEKPKEDNKDEDDGEDEPILIFANNYGMDIADANNKGPRKDLYSLKGAFHSLEFIEIEKGTSKDNIQKMLGDILYGQTNNLYNIIANKPCNEKFKLTENNKDKGEEERKDFGMLTNNDICKILKDKDAKKYIGEKSSISIVDTEEDKEYLNKKEEEYKKKIENPDEETIKLVKEIEPDAITDDDKIDTNKFDVKKLANYKLAQHKSKGTKKSGGFFTKLKNFVKGLFGGNKDEGEKYNKLIKHFDEDTNESLIENNYDSFLEWCFKPLSLQEYIFENKQ